MAIPDNKVGLSDEDVRKRRVVGGNFMIVASNRLVIKDEPCRTSGNQKWNGTRPSFIEIAAVRSAHDVGCVS